MYCSGDFLIGLGEGEGSADRQLERAVRTDLLA